MSHGKPIWLHQSRALLATVGLVATLSASPASAALVINNCTPGNIPVASSPNDVASGLGLGASVAGCFGSSVSETVSGQLLKYSYYGFEAGHINQFLLNSAVIFTTTGGILVAPSLASPLATALSTFINFAFHDVNDNTTVTNGVGTNLAQPQFFVSTLGSALALWFDDTGGGLDADFDDMMVTMEEVSRVPLPLSFPLFATGLAGLMWLRKRRAGPLGLAASNPK